MSNTIISLTMKDWTVETRRPSIGFSGENEVVTLVITTEDDLSEFNEFYLDVGWQSYETGWKTNKNIIDLAGVGPLSVNLTANMLGPDGVKRMQLRATDGTRIRKSNVFEVLVKESVNAADYYDENKSLAETIGDLNDLQTTDKSNLVAAINDVFQNAGADGLLYENNKLYLTQDGVVISDPVTIVSGGEDSGSSSGLTDTEKSLILELFSKAAYVEDDTSEAYEELTSLWSSYSITWSGVGYIHSNNATSIEKEQAFISTITANTGFSINEVVVRMGGNTVQGAWSNGTVSIPIVTGDIVITVATTQATVTGISAVYTQSGTVYDTDSLESLKRDLVVTATYADSSTYVVPASEYTLSGTLSVGTSTITVSYGGKTTTFTVTVTAAPTLTSISAVYTQSGTVYDTDSLDTMKADLVVTAHYSDSTTQTVADYTLSGTLEVGTSTVTVSYGGATATFSVTVTESPPMPLYSWDLTRSLIDTIGGVTAETTATFIEGTGIVFSEINKYCDFGQVYGRDRTYELDIAEIGTMLTDGNGYKDYARFLAFDVDATTSQGGSCVIQSVKSSRYGWCFYKGSSWGNVFVSGTADNVGNRTYFSGKTLKLYLDSTGIAKVSVKDIGASDETYTVVGTSNGALNDYTNGHVYVGSNTNDYTGNATITGLRIYEGEK